MLTNCFIVDQNIGNATYPYSTNICDLLGILGVVSKQLSLLHRRCRFLEPYAEIFDQGCCCFLPRFHIVGHFGLIRNQGREIRWTQYLIILL